jgi:hypothetical protein
VGCDIEDLARWRSCRDWDEVVVWMEVEDETRKWKRDLKVREEKENQ